MENDENLEEEEGRKRDPLILFIEKIPPGLLKGGYHSFFFLEGLERIYLSPFIQIVLISRMKTYGRSKEVITPPSSSSNCHMRYHTKKKKKKKCLAPTVYFPLNVGAARNLYKSREITSSKVLVHWSFNFSCSPTLLSLLFVVILFGVVVVIEKRVRSMFGFVTRRASVCGRIRNNRH